MITMSSGMGNGFTSCAAGGGLIRPPQITPGLLTGCSFYFDAQAANLIKDGSDLVSHMTDLSGNGRNATQATGANQPKWYSGLGPNSFDTVRFNGSTNYLDTGAVGNSSSERHAFVVLKANAMTSIRPVCAGQWGRGGPWCNGSTHWWNFDTSGFTDTTIVGDTTAFHVIYFRNRNGTSAAAIWFDSTRVLFTGNYGTADQGVNIGSQNGASYFGSFDLTSLMIYNQAISDQQVESIFAFLRGKYAL